MRTTDDDLLAILELLPKDAAFVPLNGYAVASKVVKDYSAVIEKLFGCLKKHTDLSYEAQLYFDLGQLHIHPYTGAMSLAGYSIAHGPSQAIDWYRGVINTYSAEVRHAGLVSGLSAKDRIDFSNGVSILPLDQAGNAPQVEWFRSLSLAHPLQNVLGTHFNAVACKETKHDRTEEVPKRPIDHEVITAVEEVLIGCALNDGLAPALTLHWTEFVDPKLRAADVSWGTNGFPQDAPVAFGRLVLSEDIPNVELFLGLEDGFKRKMRVALSRVGLARRRSTSANKAIEYSIALEALLSDGNSEMTHKIATRAAIILSKDLKERIHYRKLIKKLYRIRSRAVHGEDVSKGDDFQVIKDSETAISMLLLIAAKRGEDFDFERLDLDREF